ncbi:MAG: hypothetical protein ACREBE_03830 [bacterium]
MRRFTVLGFTEAELGFVLAATFAAFGVAYSAPGAAAETALAQADSAYRVAAKSRDSAQVALTTLRDSLRKKSNLTPPCYEKGEPRAPIAELTVLGRDRYAIDSTTIGFAELESRLATQIARGAALGCKYHGSARAHAGVDAPVHAAAMKRLKSRFYVDERAK